MAEDNERERNEREARAFRSFLDMEAQRAAEYVRIVQGDPGAVDRHFTDHCAKLARERLSAGEAITKERAARDARFAKRGRALRKATEPDQQERESA